MTFPFFIVFIVVGFETLRYHFNYIAAQILVNRAVEMVRTRPEGTGGQSATQIANNLSQELQTLSQGLNFFQNDMSLCISVQNTPNNCLQANAPNCLAGLGTCSVGRGREMFLVRVRKPITLVFGVGTFQIDAIGIGRHEPRVS